MITAALNNDLADVDFEIHNIFGLNMPKNCPEVPDHILNPKNTWQDSSKYDDKANELAKAFNENFVQFADQANNEILSAAPKVI
jgi:phosphoenolpyruvate carboxykinase (ATP)